jgi:hypothetical protein
MCWQAAEASHSGRIDKIRESAQSRNPVSNRFEILLERFQGRLGNAHHLVISQDYVRVACEFSDDYPPCTLTTGDFKQILLAWLNLIDPDANEGTA